MVIIDGKKYACQSCIRGHRASSCKHADRELIPVRPKGRPATQCPKCRNLRKTKHSHVKCNCKDLQPADTAETTATVTIDTLLNPCKCSEHDFCQCCKPYFNEYLFKIYDKDDVSNAASNIAQN
ncbi:copper-binding transcription factor, partial [Spiromyces aspiralis]